MQGGQYYRQQEQNRDAPQGRAMPGRDDYPEGSCPECGAELQDAEFAAKHSIQHYGDLRLNDQGHVNLIARQRQAQLRGWPIPER